MGLSAMERPHVLVIPLPAQGHVIPFMDLSHCLIDRGFRITFVNTEFNHSRVMNSLPKTAGGNMHEHLRLVSIPDGMEPGEDGSDAGRLCDCVLQFIPRGLEDLIRKINESDGDKITFVIADGTMACAMEVAEKMGIPRAAFWTGAVAFWAQSFHIPKLIEDGIIDANGILMKEQMIELSPALPPMNSTQLSWLSCGDRISQQSVFRLLYDCSRADKIADWFLCNSCYEIEPAAFELLPKVLPIGPLHAGSRLGRLEGNFWPEDSTCLSWLDEQPARSVIYVAFGSFTLFNQHQFQELALGLELLNRPFLWVVRPNITDDTINAYPDGFKTRVADRGQIVSWSPQPKVLAHPSIACFITHCGWNSTTEGLCNGVPFLCWPYFADQLIDQTYICDIWKVGFRMEKDLDDGIVSREEIKGKIEELLDDEGIRARSLELKAVVRKSVAEGGSSSKNFNDFVEAMKSVKC